MKVVLILNEELDSLTILTQQIVVFSKTYCDIIST